MSNLSGAAHRCVPVKRAHAPHVDKRGGENADENKGLPISAPAKLAARNRPQKDEDRFKIEDNEQHRDHVKLDREPDMGGAFRDDARLVNSSGGGLPVSLAQDVGNTQHGGHDEEHQAEIY